MGACVHFAEIEINRGPNLKTFWQHFIYLIEPAVHINLGPFLLGAKQQYVRIAFSALASRNMKEDTVIRIVNHIRRAEITPNLMRGYQLYILPG